MPRILIFSALTGISFSSALLVGGYELGIGFVASDLFSRYLNSGLQTIMVIVSLIFTIFFIFRLAKFFRDILENRLAGIVTALLGFTGSFLVMLAPQVNSHVLIGGVGMWTFAAFIVVLFRKKK